MKKIAMAISVLCALSAISTHAAKLDVHGDILVNGKVVINSDGTFVGLPEAPTLPVVKGVNVGEYVKQGNGVSILKGTNLGNELIYENKGNENGMVTSSFSSTSENDSSTHLFEYKGYLTYASYSFSSDFGGCSAERTITNATKLSDFGSVPFGTTVTVIEQFDEVVGCQYPDMEEQPPQETSITSMYKYTPLQLTSYSGEAGEFKDCLQYTVEHNGGDYVAIETACKGVGVVLSKGYTGEWNDGYQQEIVSFTSSAE